MDFEDFTLMHDGTNAAQGHLDVMQKITLAFAMRIPLGSYRGREKSTKMDAKFSRKPQVTFQFGMRNQSANAYLRSFVGCIDQFHVGKIQSVKTMVDD
jgi:hypothetical protein